MGIEMDQEIKDDLWDHIKKTTTDLQHLDGIYGMCLSIVELSAKQGLKDLSVGLPPFMTWGGSDTAPVEEIVREWNLRPFITRAREEVSYEE